MSLIDDARIQVIHYRGTTCEGPKPPLILIRIGFLAEDQCISLTEVLFDNYLLKHLFLSLAYFLQYNWIFLPFGLKSPLSLIFVAKEIPYFVMSGVLGFIGNSDVRYTFSLLFYCL